ncbi:MAG: bifunctional biotin--[acetyl-CoA-carboxylase] ligase/biotin operon repressor BirA [Gammaproteobacteria bacterium]|nr:bifunctional biotin--[acetyl-CoA-carboxylase] ligase/biotin operon repressor BirA [Gammaproteobacteria bacterium]
MTTRSELLRLLSDGTFHSGTALGKKLGITRAAVCKSIRHLTQTGLDVHRVTGRGYKLDAPLSLLERARILKYLGAGAGDFRDRLSIVDEVDSTNAYLAEQLAANTSFNGSACLAETQWHGRGRRGRAWVATPYSNVMLSMAWQFPSGPNLISGLSLAAGVTLLQALEEFGISGVGLKWPNDILWEQRKLAGLLADVQGEAAGPTRVILGVGVNVYISPADAKHIDQAWVDLHSITGKLVDRNRLSALLLRHFKNMFEQFAAKGFAPFRAAWQARHLYQDKRVRLIQGEREFQGTVAGIDDNGGLIVHHAKGTQVFHSGEISMRPVA